MSTSKSGQVLSKGHFYYALIMYIDNRKFFIGSLVEKVLFFFYFFPSKSIVLNHGFRDLFPSLSLSNSRYRLNSMCLCFCSWNTYVHGELEGDCRLSYPFFSPE